MPPPSVGLYVCDPLDPLVIALVVPLIGSPTYADLGGMPQVIPPSDPGQQILDRHGVDTERCMMNIPGGNVATKAGRQTGKINQYLVTVSLNSKCSPGSQGSSHDASKTMRKIPRRIAQEALARREDINIEGIEILKVGSPFSASIA